MTTVIGDSEFLNHFYRSIDPVAIIHHQDHLHLADAAHH